jgi:hypothetical protein
MSGWRAYRRLPFNARKINVNIQLASEVIFEVIQFLSRNGYINDHPTGNLCMMLNSLRLELEPNISTVDDGNAFK